MPIAFKLAGVIKGALGGPNVLQGPTSLQFGPDGRLYVSEQNGSINAFTVSLSDGKYVATQHEQLEDALGNEIVKSIQNHDDDGSLAGNTSRQVTGIVVGGTAEVPVVYVSSSDPRIAQNAGDRPRHQLGRRLARHLESRDGRLGRGRPRARPAAVRGEPFRQRHGPRRGCGHAAAAGRRLHQQRRAVVVLRLHDGIRALGRGARARPRRARGAADADRPRRRAERHSARLQVRPADAGRSQSRERTHRPNR